MDIDKKVIDKKDWKIIMIILDELLYWETCPEEYKRKIRKIQETYR